MYISHYLFYKPNGDGTYEFKIAAFGSPERERAVSLKLEQEGFFEKRIDGIIYNAMTTYETEIIS